MDALRQEDVLKAAEAGDSSAMFEVGLQLLKGKVDAANGVEWLRRCISAREVSASSSAVPDAVLASACYALGYAYETGIGVACDMRLSASWIARSASLGHPQGTKLVASRRRDRWARRMYDLMLLMCLVALLGVGKTLFELVYVLLHREEFKEEVSGADPATPPYVWRRNVIGASARGEMIARALDLVQQTSKEETANPLSDSFAHSRGVVAHFDRSALNDTYAFASDELRWLRDGYISNLLDERCNAFVFNVLIVPPGRSRNRTRGVDYHVDQTLIQSVTQRGQSAFSVSVGYLQVPEQIDGGELILNGMRHSPHEGSVLVFRGDQKHAVNAFCASKIDSSGQHQEVWRGADCDIKSDPDLQRISFVLEQYLLPPAKLRRTPSFILAPSDMEQEIISVISTFPLGPAVIEFFLQIRKRLYWRSRRAVRSNDL